MIQNNAPFAPEIETSAIPSTKTEFEVITWPSITKPVQSIATELVPVTPMNPPLISDLKMWHLLDIQYRWHDKLHRRLKSMLHKLPHFLKNPNVK